MRDSGGGGTGGCGLRDNLDVMVCRAEWHYHQGANQVQGNAPALDSQLPNLGNVGGLWGAARQDSIFCMLGPSICPAGS
jgi:hypothetical protein